MEIIRWTLGIILLALFMGAAVTNACLLYRFMVGKEKGTFVLIIGGFIGLAGLLLLPVPSAWKWWWAPFLLDVGAGPVLLMLASVEYVWARTRSES